MSGSAGGRGYSFRIGAEGFKEFVQDLTRIAGSSTEAQRAIETLIRSSPQLASSLNTAAEATERAAKRAVELRQAQETASAASQSGVARYQAAGAALGGLESRALAAGRATNDLRGGLELLGASGIAGQLGPVAGTIGNLADLLGTASLAAGRFEGLIGLVGRAALPVGIAIAAAAVATTDWGKAADSVGSGLRTLTGASYDTERATNSYRGAVELLSQSLEDAAGKERRLAQETRDRLATQADAALSPTREALTAAERRLEQLQPIADQVAAARALDPDTQIGGAAGRRFADYQAVAADVARMRAQIAEVEARIRDQRDVPFRQGAAVAPSAPPRTPSNTGTGGRAPSRAPDLPSVTVYEYTDDAGQTVFPAEVIQAAWERNNQIADRAREQAAQAAQRAEERSLQQREQANQRSTDAIVNYGADAFATMLDRNGRGFDGFLDTLEATFRRTIARIAAEALIRPIVQPIVAEFGLGNIAGTFGGGSTGTQAAGGTGGVSTLSSGASLANSASSLGGAGAGFSSLGTAGSYSGLAANAGYFAAGYTGGSLVGGYIAGDSKAKQENANIGAGIGTLIGAFFGPAGALLGGLAGGAIGGLIGPGPKTNAFGFEVNADGQFSTSRFGTTGNGQGGAEIYAQTQQLLAQANAIMTAAGVTVRARDLVIGANNNSPQPGNLNETFGEFRFSAANNARLNTAVDGRSFGSVDQLAATIQAAQEMIALIDGFAAPMTNYAQQLRQINTAFGEAVLVARQLGFGEAELATERLKQIEILDTSRREVLLDTSTDLNARLMRAQGRDAEAEAYVAEREAVIAQRDLAESLKQLGLTTADAAPYVNQLNAVIEAEAAARARAVEEAKKQDAEQAARAAANDNLARNNAARSLLEQLTFGGVGGLSPEAQGTAARQALDAAQRAVLADPSAANVQEYSRIAQTTLGVIRQTEGITQGFGGLVGSVNDTLRQVAPGADIANLGGVIDATTRVEDAIYQTGGLTRAGLDALNQQIGRLSTQIAALMAKAA